MSAMNYPTRDGRPYVLTDEKLEDLKRKFSDVPVDRELQMAWHWLDENPEKRKVSRGTGWFLVSWLNRSRDAAARGKEVPPSHIPYRDKQAVSLVSMLRSRCGEGGHEMTDAKLLTDHFSRELAVCRRCEMAYNLTDLRRRLSRYLWLEAGVRREEADIMARAALPHG